MDRPPHIDLEYPRAGRGEARHLGRAKDIAHPLRAAFHRVVDMHAPRRAAQAVAVFGAGAAVGTPRYVENNHPPGTEPVLQQRLGFGEILVVDRTVIVEIRDGGPMVQQLEPFAVDGQLVRDPAHIADRDCMLLNLEEYFRHAARQRGTVEHRFGILRADEEQRAGYIRKRLWLSGLWRRGGTNLVHGIVSRFARLRWRPVREDALRQGPPAHAVCLIRNE